MGKDRFFLGIFFFTFFYGAYLFYDNKNFNDYGVQNIIDTRNKMLHSKRFRSNALIVGGSNALWGVSAESLSLKTHFSFYNLTMHSNGVNHKNYFSYIKESISDEHKDSIELILWSTIFPFKEPPYDDFDRDISGKLRFSKLYPNKSLLNALYDQFQDSNQHLFGVTESYGDFNFAKFKCPLSNFEKTSSLAEDIQSNIEKYYGNNPFFLEQLIFYRKFFRLNFPNARVIYVIPSLYNPPIINEVDLESLSSLLTENEMELLIQSPLDFNLLCDAWHHPNEKGRAFRTNELAEKINDIF